MISAGIIDITVLNRTNGAGPEASRGSAAPGGVCFAMPGCRGSWRSAHARAQCPKALVHERDRHAALCDRWLLARTPRRLVLGELRWLLPFVVVDVV